MNTFNIEQNVEDII